MTHRLGRLSRAVGASELLIAAALWGFGFIATVWALREVGPFRLTFLRFAVAGVVLIPIVCRAEGRRQVLRYLKPAFGPAFLLVGLLIMQTWGLMFTTATKSGFITTLYVVIVPLLDAALNRRRISPFLWACVLTSILGTVLIVDVGLDTLNFGDLLTAGSAIFASLQILSIGRVSRGLENPFVFNCVQSLWGAVVALPFALSEGPLPMPAQILNWSPHALAGLLSLSFGSTVIAFALQLRAQKRLSNTVASLLFLLESPIGMLFAMWLLNEQLSWREGIGATLIFLSAVVAVVR